MSLLFPIIALYLQAQYRFSSLKLCAPEVYGALPVSKWKVAMDEVTFLKARNNDKIFIHDFYTLTREIWKAKALGIPLFNNV